MLDELNIIAEGKKQEIRQNINNAQKCVDIILDLLIYSYIYGNNTANEQLNTAVKPSVDVMEDSIYRKVAGKTFAERVVEYAADYDIENILRVADTELHRVYNDAAYSTAVKAGAKSKRWMTMADDRVRETHDYLFGQSVPIDAKFYTYDGDSAYYPGDFNLASNNVRCRCELEFEK